MNSFVAGEGGAKLLARRWNVPEEKIRTWVSCYRPHGVSGLRPKRSINSSEFKQQVLCHQDCGRLSSRQLSAIYDIRNPNQVVVWRRSGVETLGNNMTSSDDTWAQAIDRHVSVADAVTKNKARWQANGVVKLIEIAKNIVYGHVKGELVFLEMWCGGQRVTKTTS